MHYNRISADCHLDLIWLPPDLFVSEAPPGLKDRMPYVEDSPDGPRWVAKNGAVFGLVGGVGASGQKYVKGKQLRVDIMADFIVPKGYREFLEYAGAVAVHNRYPDRPMDPDVRIKAEYYKARVKAAQSTPSFIRSDDAVLRGDLLTQNTLFNGRTLIP